MKRLVTIQDISCIGKCSLTAALPIISAAGIETAVIPTAVLSAHTAFNSFTFLDLTPEIEKIADNWKAKNLDFDGIYTGYLGSTAQLDIVSRFIDAFRTEKTTVIIDPVMGDNAKLYTGFSSDFPEAMKFLCKKADIIVPNLTEAAFLTNTEYPTSYSEHDIKNLLLKLAVLGAETTVLTGISLCRGQTGIMSYNSKTDTFFSYYNEKIEQNFHGTGDVFAAAFAGAVISGISVNKALEIAVLYTIRSIKLTLEDKTAVWYGVNFEQAIPYYAQLINAEKNISNQ